MMMDHKQQCNQEYPPSLLLSNTTTTTNNTAPAAASSATPSPKKPPVSGGGGNGGGDRSKRDEWSEGAVSTLIDAYESKWVLRNRAKLKGQDWEDVARYVSSRTNCSKSPKTQTQCKNKIESMKKRYRSESATSDGSSWPLFQRLDLLLRGSGPPTPIPPTTPHLPPTMPPQLPPPPTPTILPRPPTAVTDPPPPVHHHQIVEPLLPSIPQEEARPQPSPQPPPPPVPAIIGQNSHGSDGGGLDHRLVTKEDETAATKLVSDPPENNVNVSDKNNIAMDTTDSSTPAARYSDNKDKLKQGKRATMRSGPDKGRKKRRREEYVDVAESIRWLAEVVVRTEQARMETMKELEKMRAESEAKRGEIDLKRTQIMANTQLEIARIFSAAGGAAVGKGNNIDSSLRIGRS